MFLRSKRAPVAILREETPKFTSSRKERDMASSARRRRGVRSGSKGRGSRSPRARKHERGTLPDPNKHPLSVKTFPRSFQRTRAWKERTRALAPLPFFFVKKKEKRGPYTPPTVTTDRVRRPSKAHAPAFRRRARFTFKRRSSVLGWSLFLTFPFST